MELSEPYYGKRWLQADGRPAMLFTENDTNRQALWNIANASPYTKDAFHRYVIHGETGAVNPASTGTKAAAHYSFTLAPGGSARICLRLSDQRLDAAFGAAFDQVFADRIREAERVLRRHHAATSFRRTRRR